MQRSFILLDQPKKLVGITTKTNNKKFELNPSTSLIGRCVNDYFQYAIANKISHRKTPGITYCAYTSYESDYKGDYTFFIGEEVELSAEVIDNTLTIIEVPSGKYVKYTTTQGAIPNIVQDAWQEIWGYTTKELDGERAYLVDFEIYDKRAQDPNKAVMDIYLGIK